MAKRVFILCESMRAQKNAVFVEGTDIAMDFPDKYPLPLETEVLENGKPITIRVLPNCPFLEKEKQLKNGYPAVYHYTASDEDRIAFKFRRLELDESRDKIWLDYVERTPWMAGNEERKTRHNTKTIFEKFDEEANIKDEIKEEGEIIRAKGMVLDLNDSEVRNLYRLANPGSLRNDGLITLGKMRKHLLDVSAVNPRFVFDGVKTGRDKIIVLVSRAIEERIISLDFPGAVALYSPAEDEYQNLVSVNDALGQEAKFDRLVDYLQTEEGQTELAIIEDRLEAEPAESKSAGKASKSVSK